MTIDGIHLVGSVPLANAAEVFQVTAEELSAHVCRLPDGETEARSNWIQWQFEKLAASPQLQTVDVSLPDGNAMQQLELRPGAAQIDIPDLGYREAALASYATFSALKESGAIPPDCRFQVSLPTPLAPINFYVVLPHRATVEKAYQDKLLTELAQICAAIPHHELAVQWDTAVEFGILEGVFPSHLQNPMPDIIERLLLLGHAVPDAVELGYHLCYGDSGHQHFKEPDTMDKLVDVANRVSTGLQRPLQWMHMPVPRNRHDDAYFEPLTHLTLAQETELYLGLVHMTDGLDGAQKRTSTAKKYTADFGIATECGFGRRPASTVPELLRLHKQILDAQAS